MMKFWNFSSQEWLCSSIVGKTLKKVNIVCKMDFFVKLIKGSKIGNWEMYQYSKRVNYETNNY